MVRAEAIGWRAHAALTASAGVAKVIAPLSRSFYAEAAGELIWIGDPETLLHPRAVLATDVIVPAAGEAWAPLHDLARALVCADMNAAHRSARELTTLGDSSGWSLLAGVVVGLSAG